MKRLTVILCVLALLGMAVAQARTIMVVGGGQAAAAVGQWYYYDGTSTEPAWNETAGFGGSSYYLGDTITGVSGKSITKLSFNFSGKDANTDGCKVAAYNADGSTLLGSAEVLYANITADGWTDVTVSSFTPSGNIVVAVQCEDLVTFRRYSGADGWWGNTTSYAAFPEASITMNTDSSKAWAVRAWGQ